MTFDEIVIIVGGLFFGFVMVSAFLAQDNNDTSNRATKKENSNSANKSAENKNPSVEESIETTWYKTLEVSESAAMSEINIKYKQKIREYHPDKVASLGEELRHLAECRAKEINSAYEFAKRFKR